MTRDSLFLLFSAHLRKINSAPTRTHLLLLLGGDERHPADGHDRVLGLPLPLPQAADGLLGGVRQLLDAVVLGLRQELRQFTPVRMNDKKSRSLAHVNLQAKHHF